MYDLSKLQFIQARHYTKGRTSDIQLIELHDEESPDRNGSALNVAHYFAGPSAPQASAHLTIDNLTAILCVHFEDTAWAVINSNHNSINLEHAGYASETVRDWESDYNKAMLEQSAQITAALCYEYNIPAALAVFAGPDDETVITPGITTHGLTPNHVSGHTDPGPNFPLTAYIARVAAILAEIQNEQTAQDSNA